MLAIQCLLLQALRADEIRIMQERSRPLLKGPAVAKISRRLQALVR
jgi:hypothetical protein